MLQVLIAYPHCILNIELGLLYLGPCTILILHPLLHFFIIFLCYYFYHDSIIIRMCFTMKLGVDLSIMCLISLRTFVDFNSHLIENCYS